MVTIEIDGKKVSARDGAMLIEAADEAGISIPRFCYHKKLSIAANCRMCLVDVEKAAKPLPACATPITEGMKVRTQSAKAVDAQKGVMEFLLINHPLDCPICDQGGECDLQELAMGYGGDLSRYTENKRVVKDKNLGSLISTDMTRCIHCTRCVRFGEEIAGIMELGATGRGEHMEIGTYIEKAVASELSGNVIDLCPVGALTSKPFRYSARPWELTQLDTIAPHDCMGSNLIAHVRGNRVMRILPRENEEINETWISDRDRFSYAGLNSEDRVAQPRIKRDGEWCETDWESALEYAVAGIKSIINTAGASQLGTLISPSATIEEMYLSQQLSRALGSSNIDHRLRQLDFDDQGLMPVLPGLGMGIHDLEQLDAVLLIGSNIRKEQPMAAHRLRKAVLNGGKLMLVNPIDFSINSPVENKLIVGTAGMAVALAQITRTLLDISGATPPPGLVELLGDIEPSETALAIAERLKAGDKAAVILGSLANADPCASTIRALASVVAQTSNATMGYLSEGGNSAGAYLAGVLPHRGPGGEPVAQPGLNARAMLEANLRGYILLGVEPELDCADSATALQAVTGADFVVSLSPFTSKVMEQYAHVILPVAPFTETSGSFVNVEGRWQSFTGVVSPLGETRPAWKVLRVLGNLFSQQGFDYVSSEQIRDAVRAKTSAVKLNNDLQWQCPAAITRPNGVFTNGVFNRVADTPLYAVDGTTRRASPLQQTQDAGQAAIYLNQRDAERLGLQGVSQAVARHNNTKVSLPLLIDDGIPDNCVRIQAGLAATVGLGLHGAEIEIVKE